MTRAFSATHYASNEEVVYRLSPKRIRIVYSGPVCSDVGVLYAWNTSDRAEHVSCKRCLRVLAKVTEFKESQK